MIVFLIRFLQIHDSLSSNHGSYTVCITDTVLVNYEINENIQHYLLSGHYEIMEIKFHL